MRALLATTAATLGALAGLAAVPPRFLLYLATRGPWRRRLEEALAAPRPPLPPAPPKPPRPASSPPATIFLSVGDVSAEAHAVRLLREANARRSNLRWIGFGGRRLREAGCEIRADLVGLGLIGFASVFKALPRLLRIVHAFARALREDRPDLVLLLDYPGLHFLLARLARRAGVPVVYYIAPQVWAWAPWRAKRLRRDVARLLCILPFEPRWFEEQGVRASFVGHPIADAHAERAPEGAPVEDPDRVAILPGSRRKEIRANLPSQARVFARLRAANPRLRGVVAHAAGDLAPLLRDLAGPGPEVSTGDFHGAIRGSRLALAKSGTAILEVALHSVPMVVLYRVSRPLAAAARSILCTPWFASVNLLANREIVPEFCFDRDAVEEEIAAAAQALLRDGPERAAALEGLARVRASIEAPGTAARAASAVLEELERPRPARPRGRGLRRLAAALLSLVVAVSAAEFATRALDPFGASYFRETLRYRTEGLRFLGPPDRAETLEGAIVEHVPLARVPFRRFVASFNSLGLRGPEVALPKPEDAYRILFLGDSVVFGWGVNDEATFVRRLEKVLNARGGRFRYETVNGGHLVFDTTQEAALLETKGWALSPDLVLLVYVVNDVEPTRGIVERFFAEARSPSLSLRLRGTFSRLLPALSDLFAYVSASGEASAASSPPRGADETREAREGWNRSAAALLRIRDSCIERRTPLLLLDHSLPPIEALPVFCEREGIAYEPFRLGAGESGPPFRNSSADAHPNGRGHEALLRRLEAALAKRGLPPGIW